MTYAAQVARQVDTALREVLLLLAQRDVHLLPADVDQVRLTIIEAVLGGSRIQPSNDVDPVPGPWDDAPTLPQRPSNRPPRR